MKPRPVLIIAAAAEVCNAVKHLESILDGDDTYPSLIDEGASYEAWIERLLAALETHTDSLLYVVAEGIHPHVFQAWEDRRPPEDPQDFINPFGAVESE